MHPCTSRTAPAGARPLFLALLILLLGTAPALAQSGTLRVTVSDSESRPLANAAVRIDGTRLGAFTGTDGRATISGVPAGDRSITASLLGYGDQRSIVTIVAGGTVDMDLVLAAEPLQVSGIQVSVLRPDLRPEVRLEEAQLEETQTHDIGGVLRDPSRAWMPSAEVAWGWIRWSAASGIPRSGPTWTGCGPFRVARAGWIRPSPTWIPAPSGGWRWSRGPTP
jgi:hypothetical protein